MKNNIHGFIDKLLSVKPCMLFYMGAISRVSFSDLFGLIIGVTNPIM